MHWRIYGSALALLSFAVVCFSGLLQGHSFASAIKHSLLAMVIGGVTGALAAVAVSYVVREEAGRKDQDVEEKLPLSGGGGWFGRKLNGGHGSRRFTGRAGLPRRRLGRKLELRIHVW